MDEDNNNDKQHKPDKANPNETDKETKNANVTINTDGSNTRATENTEPRDMEQNSGIQVQQHDLRRSSRASRKRPSCKSAGGLSPFMQMKKKCSRDLQQQKEKIRSTISATNAPLRLTPKGPGGPNVFKQMAEIRGRQQAYEDNNKSEELDKSLSILGTIDAMKKQCPRKATSGIPPRMGLLGSIANSAVARLQDDNEAFPTGVLGLSEDSEPVSSHREAVPESDNNAEAPTDADSNKTDSNLDADRNGN